MKLKIALFAVIAILVVSLAANAYLCKERDIIAQDDGLQKQANTDLQKLIADLSNKTNNLQNEKSDLLSQVKNLKNQTDILQSENSNLTTKIANLQLTIADLQLNLPNRPNLVTRIGVTDVKDDSGGHTTFRPRLFVQGEVFNTGGITARNARLHVTLFIGNQIVNDAYIELGNIEPLLAVHVEQDIYYDSTGARLTNWTIIPEASS